MSEDLDQLETWVAGLLSKASAAERRRLARAVATDLRRSQAQRIAQQRNPDGSPFAPRKPRPALRSRSGRIKRQARKGAMFGKLRTARHLRTSASPSIAEVGFSGRASRIARVHQLGLRDRVEPRPGAPEVAYPARVLLGFTDEDRKRLLDAVLAHLDPH